MASQSLFYWKLFYNLWIHQESRSFSLVTILILLETLLQLHTKVTRSVDKHVTILILLETLLQRLVALILASTKCCHNPYFTGNSFTTQNGNAGRFVWIQSQSLFYWKLFYNISLKINWCIMSKVTILILLETLLQQ